MVKPIETARNRVEYDLSTYQGREQLMRAQGLTRGSLFISDLKQGFGTLAHILSLPIQILKESFAGRKQAITDRREERLISRIDPQWRRLQGRVPKNRRGMLQVAKEALKECKTQRQLSHYTFSQEQIEELGGDNLETLRDIAKANLSIRTAEKVAQVKLVAKRVVASAALSFGLTVYWTYLVPIVAIMAIVNLANAATVAASRGRRLDGLVVSGLAQQRIAATLNNAMAPLAQGSRSSDTESPAVSSLEEDEEAVTP